MRLVPPVGEVPPVTAGLAWKVYPCGTDEMCVRDALGALFTGTDVTTGFTTGVFAVMYSDLG